MVTASENLDLNLARGKGLGHYNTTMDSREELVKDLPSHKFGLQDLDLELAGCRSFLGTGRRAGTHRLPVTYELCPRQGSRVLSRLRPRKGDRRSRGGLGSRGEHCLGRHTGQQAA